MSKLKQLQAIQARLMEDNDWCCGLANAHIAGLLDREENTVETWLTESQRQPIPDNTLALLSLMTAPNPNHKA